MTKRSNTMETRLDLKDVTFLIPVRLDSITRVENLLMTVEHLTKYFETNINILEADGYNNGLLVQLLPSTVNHTFLEDYDPIFHRTHYINLMVKHCSTSLVAVWDSDVIVPHEQLLEAAQWLRSDKADFVRPYDKEFLDTSFIIRELYFRTRNVPTLQ